MDTESLVQWNIRGLRSNYEELKLLLNKTSTSVVALQDCKLGEEQLSPRGYALLKGNCPAGEAALLINQRVVHTELTLNSSLHAVAATVTLNKTFTICSIYLTPGESITKLSLENLIDQLPRPFLLLGDFNAHSPVWGDSRRDGRGKLIESILQDNDLILLNSKSPTFLHSAYNSTSAIDLAVASPTIALDFQWSVHDDLCGSDHFPIFLTSHAEDNTTHPRYNFKKANWNLFGDLCSRSIDLKILESDCPVELFTEKITAAAREAIPPHRGGKNLPRVPWFNEECKQAILDRKRAQRKYFKHPTLLNFINFKKAKAKSKFIIKQSKASSWRHYVSTINSHTSTKSVWKKIRKIKGKDTTQKTHLKKNTILVSDPKEQANYLAESFSKNSSSQNYSNSFQKIKDRKERTPPNFFSDNTENYNKPFLLDELKDALNKSNETAAGPDGLYYKFLTHLPQDCLKILLQLFNTIWLSGKIPSSWKEATVVPIPKPNKDLSDPTNYRPIALTSCLCKTMERMVNDRLVWVLESKKLLSKFQCGFRKDHSTLDHLVRFEHFIREAFARKKQVLAVFFDLEKAYDTTWKHGILTDLFDLEFRGRLPIFIQNFLSDRHFQVKSGSTFSNSYLQENGVPQGSILSPMLFNLKINNIMKSVSNNANASLFVDDFAVYIEGKHLKHLERSMQLCINKIQKWVAENGFKFSISKTTCVHFHKQRIYTEPTLHLDGQAIPVKDEVKFLGLIFDHKLNFKAHVAYLKKKCQKALNILRVVGHTDWGADKSTLLKLYRTLVRSKLDYGCAVYGSTKHYILKSLDPIHHQGLRIALGAFRTSPVQSLFAEAGEPSLRHRRLKLSMTYFLKLKSLPDNPCHNVINNPPPSELFERTKTISPFGTRTLPHIEEANIEPNSIDSQYERTPPPWEHSNIMFDTSLSCFKKEQTSETVLRKEFQQLRERYNSYFEAYTDGSKSEHKVAAAAFFTKDPDNPKTTRLRDGSSVFNAELEGMLLALKKFLTLSQPKNFIIYTDSLSAVESLRNKAFKIKNVKRFYNLLKKIPPQTQLVIAWVPSHVGVSGNEKADRLAKAALTLNLAAYSRVCWSDLKPRVDTYICTAWQALWNDQTRNKLYEIRPNLKESLCNTTQPLYRKQETVMTRLRIGHTWITHSYLLKKEDQPFCHACDNPFTVKHILVECSDFTHTRNKYYTTTDVHTLFREADSSKITEYLKEIKLFDKI